jgi:Phosphatidylserine/phosphatidylglycerophosphate/cardiolipin synthases and related enzymes
VLPTATPILTVTTTVIKTVERAPSGAWVEALLDEDYFSVLSHWIERANTSIHVVMYVAKYDPNESSDPVNQLLYKLAYAQSRGVDVKVVVDDETAKSYPQTIAFLKNSGIDVRLDESSARITHAKLVIIDGRVVAVGSHNWTESALHYNHEASVLIISEDIAKQFEEYFESIWSSGRAL